MRRLAFLALIGVIAASAPVVAAEPPRTSAQSPDAQLQGDGTVVSRHSVRLASGKRLSYTARAGFIPLRRDDAGSGGELLGELFFVAYTEEAPAGAARPITFFWGGGPGGSASLSGRGPRRLKDLKDYRSPPPPFEVVDNPETWLEFTDMVLIDTMGTGYSRLARPEFGSYFYSPDGDAEAATEFIRIFMRRYDVTDAPIFLSGGSYGSVRAALVSDVAERRGIPIRGAVLNALAVFYDEDSSDRRHVMMLPAYTAAAFFHKRLAPDLLEDRDAALREAEAWAQGPYAAALARGSAMTREERDRAIEGYARYTGLSPKVVGENNLRVSKEVFGNELLRDEGRIVGHYDTRVTAESAPRPFDPTTDPSLNARGAAMPRLMERLYFSRELGVNADLLGSKVDGVYLGPFGGAWPPPVGGVYPASAQKTFEWMAMRWSENREAGPAPSDALLDAIDANPYFSVLIAGGRYDLATPYFAGEYLKSRLKHDQRGQIKLWTDDAGHSLRHDVFRDVAKSFYEGVLAETPPRGRDGDWGWTRKPER